MSAMSLELFTQIQTALFQATQRLQDEERGQSFVEYIGVIAIVGVVFGLLVTAFKTEAGELGKELTAIVKKIGAEN